MKERHKPILPDYVKYMANDAIFGTKDLMDIFRFKDTSHISRLIKKGYLPEPKKVSRKINTKRKPKSSSWSKMEIIEAINKYNKDFFGE